MANTVMRGMAALENEGPIRFVNTAPSCGIDFILRNGAAGRKYQIETLPGGLGVIDFDHDGWPDLYCVNGAALPSLQMRTQVFTTVFIETTAMERSPMLLRRQE